MHLVECSKISYHEKFHCPLISKWITSILEISLSTKDETHKRGDGKMFMMSFKLMANVQNIDFSGPTKKDLSFLKVKTYRQEFVEIEVLFFFGGNNL